MRIELEEETTHLVWNFETEDLDKLGPTQSGVRSKSTPRLSCCDNLKC